MRENEKIQDLKNEILLELEEEHISKETFKDTIVSSIMKQAETICQKVRHFENENYSRKRPKN